MIVRLPDGVPERIDAMVGQNKRAEFIREAVDRELKRRERLLRSPSTSTDHDDASSD